MARNQLPAHLKLPCCAWCGHAVQNSPGGFYPFGTWGAMSADSTMIIGRNFDFYVGDKFAEDKIVAF